MPTPDDPLATLRAALAARHITLVSAEPDEHSADVRFHGEVWRVISVPGFEALRDLLVALPVEGRARLGATGALDLTAISQPTDDDVAEALSSVQSLAIHGQIAGVSPTPATRPTHHIDIDAAGRRRLVRIGFSAV